MRKKTSSGDSVPIQPPQQKTGIHHVIDISRYNALPKLLAVTACLKISQPLSKFEPKHVGPISPKERHRALQEYIKNYQAVSTPVAFFDAGGGYTILQWMTP